MRAVLERADVLSLEALRPLGDLKLHTLAFLQTLKTTRLNRREVHKNIFASLPADKTVAFGVVKPLYRALFCHLVMLFLFDRFTLEGSRKSHGQVLLVGKKLLNNRFESNAKLEYQRVGARRERVFNSILWSVKVSEDAFPAAERTPSQTRAKMEKDRISCTRRAAGIPVGHQCDLSTAPCASKRFRSSVSTVVGINMPPCPFPVEPSDLPFVRTAKKRTLKSPQIGMRAGATSLRKPI